MIEGLEWGFGINCDMIAQGLCTKNENDSESVQRLMVQEPAWLHYAYAGAWFM